MRDGFVFGVTVGSSYLRIECFFLVVVCLFCVSETK